MADYQKLYITMYNAATAALAEMEKMNYGRARTILRTAQQETEKTFRRAIPAPPLETPPQ